MAELTYQTLRENVADIIKKKIFRYELAPGTRIKEQELASELGISRGPIREALRQLEQEGLVEYSRNIGCSVKFLTLQDLYEIYLMSMTCEIIAVKMCKGRFKEENLAALEDSLRLMKGLRKEDNEQMLEYDHDFHGAIVRMSGLKRLVRFWHSLRYGTTLDLFWIPDKVGERVLKTYEHHLPLYKACLAGDEKLICQIIYDHYMDNIRKFIDIEGLTEEQLNFSVDVMKEWIQ